MIYIFNRWLKMLKTYGKLDQQGLNDDFCAISKAVRNKAIDKELRHKIRSCRDLAISQSPNISALIETLKSTLDLLCKSEENQAIEIIAQAYADQGMTERYRPLTKRLANEKVRKIGRKVIYIDPLTDDKESSRLMRRIIEKRAAQTVFRNAKKSDRNSNRFRQSVRRAISFSLHSTKFTDYDAQLRSRGTHWRVVHQNSKREKVLAAKKAYNSYADALDAIERYALKHPNDHRPVSAYVCVHCGKWHIGHESFSGQSLDPSEDNLYEVC